MKYLLGFLLVIIWSGVFGQDILVRTYGGIQNEKSSDIIETTDGGFLLLGSTGSSDNTNSDVYLVKIDVNLEYQWSKTFGGINSDQGVSIVKTEDNNYLILGNSIINNSYYISLFKVTPTGDLLWEESIGGNDWDFGNSLISDQNGGFLIGGQTFNFGSQNGQGYIIKIDDLGNIIWEETYPEYSKCNKITQDIDGNVLFIGDKIVDGLSKASFSKIDPLNGVIDWSVDYGILTSFGFEIIVFDSNIYICGKLIDDFNRYFFVSYDLNGLINWEKVSTFEGDRHLNSIVINPSLNQVLSVGSTNGFDINGEDMYIVRRNISSGSFIDNVSYGGVLSDEAIKVLLPSSNKITILSNLSNFNNANTDIGIIQFPNDTTISDIPFDVGNYNDLEVNLDNEILVNEETKVIYNKNKVIFSLSSFLQDGILNIYSINGSLIETKLFNSNEVVFKYDEKYRKGIYNYRITGNDQIITGKVLIN